MEEKKFNLNKKMYNKTMKLDDIDIELANKEDEAEDKRKQLHHYQTFKQKQEKQAVSFQINIIDEDGNKGSKKETDQGKSSDLLYKKESIHGEQLSGTNLDSEYMLDSNIPRRRKKKRYSSAILETVKIGTDSFRTLKDHKFSDDYTILNCIGQGGYGKVYKCKHNTMGYTRAMKSK